MENLIHQHGGDLDAIERRYGIPKKEIVDFSGNINPLGFPESVKKELAENLDIVSSYPDKNYTALKKSISQYTGADSEKYLCRQRLNRTYKHFYHIGKREKSRYSWPGIF